MKTTAVVLESPHHLALRDLDLVPLGPGDVLVDIEWSAISTGTERLLYTGKMPPFPGMGYPLVPGYESVGRIVQLGDGAGDAKLAVHDRVFVPGAASCFGGGVRSLFGGAAARLVVPASRVMRLGEGFGEESVLLALAATALHALCGASGDAVTQLASAGEVLIVGHGALGRLLARLVVALGGQPPVVWEKNERRRLGGLDRELGYTVIDPTEDRRTDYRSIIDVSGDASLIEALLRRLAKGGEITLAGFYPEPITFAFPLAFLKEACLRVSAEWQPGDLSAVVDLISKGALSLDGLITHRRSFREAPDAYATAFTDPDCLKMLIEWSSRKANSDQ